MVQLLARNREFRGIYDYYVTHVKNPLKRRQAMVAVSCNEYYGAAEPPVRSIQSQYSGGIEPQATLIWLDYHLSGRTVLVKAKAALAGR